MDLSLCQRTSALVVGVVFSLVVVGAATSGCAYRRTPPLTKYDLTKGYRFNPPPERRDRRFPKNSEQLFVVLALSGGGTRAAALSYGVLHELDRVKFCWNDATGQAESCPPPGDPRRAGMERTLLDEVDVISSVSGGSFTAAYYALKQREIFNPDGPFHRAFLYHKVQRDLFAQAAYYPQNWKRLRSRVEIAANYYATHVFGDATYRSLEGRRPYIVLNATDMSSAARFEFTQDHFDLLCANLSEFPIARAVAASSAFPGLLNSMTIDSYNAQGCQYRGPGSGFGDDWVKLADQDQYVNYRRYRAAQEVKLYRDPNREHLHLLDGGLADNIGARAILQSLTSTDAPVQQTDDPNRPIVGGWSVLSRINMGQVKHLVVIVVNARTNRTRDWDSTQAGPSTLTVVGAAGGLPMSTFSYETMKDLQEYGTAHALNLPGRPKFHAFEIAFENIASAEERQFFANMPTSFELSRYEVDCLMDRGARLMRESTSIETLAKPFAAVVKEDLQGEAAGESLRPPGVCTAAEGRQKVGLRTQYVNVGAQWGVRWPASDDVKRSQGFGVAVRATRPDGWGVLVDYGTESFPIRGEVDGRAVDLGDLRLRAVSGGIAFTQHFGNVEASASLSAGYGFGGFDLSQDAREAYVRAGRFGLDADATNTWLIRPGASLWINLTRNLAATTSIGYVYSRPTLRVTSDSRDADRHVRAAAVRAAVGLGFKVF